MTPHPLPRSYRSILILGSLLTASLVVYSLAAIPPGNGILGAVLSLSAFFVFSLTLGRTLLALRTYQVFKGNLLVRFLGFTREYPLDALGSWEDDPASGQLILTFPGKTLRIPRKIRGFQDFQHNFFEALGEIEEFPVQPPIHLTASKTGLVFLALVLVLVVVFAFLVLPETRDNQGLFFFLTLMILSLGAVLILRILRSEALGFHLYPREIKVRYLQGEVSFPIEAAHTLVEDSYTADGAVYRVVRLGFGRQNVVLDEFNLHRPLKPLLPWMRENWLPLIRSTF